jgi:Tol biopolymer transport system component
MARRCSSRARATAGRPPSSTGRPLPTTRRREPNSGWRATTGPATYGDSAHALRVSPDGSKLYVIGTTDYDYDIATVAYNAGTGAQLWAKTYGTGTTTTSFAAGVRVSPDGSTVFVTGYAAFRPTRDDFVTIAYNATTGAAMWTKRYNNGMRNDDAEALAVSPDGSKVFVTGRTATYLYTNMDWATVAYDAATGNQLWAKQYNDRANGDDSATELGVSPDGSKVFVTGESTGGSSGMDWQTIAYNATTGATIWAKTVNGVATNSDDEATALGVSTDGSKVIVTGCSTGSNGNHDYLTIAWDATTTAQAWAKRYNGPANGDDCASALSVSPDGSKVAVTGASAGSTANDYATIAYSMH